MLKVHVFIAMTHLQTKTVRNGWLPVKVGLQKCEHDVYTKYISEEHTIQNTSKIIQLNLH